MGRTIVARGGVGHPEAVLTGMVGPELGVGRDTVGGTEDGLGCPGAELVAGGGGLLSAADDCGATGPTELGAGSGLAAGDGDGDADGVGHGDGVPCCFGTAARVAAAGFAVSGFPCEVSTNTTSITAAITAIPTAPATATADRKLMSSIRPFSTSRSRRSPLTTQHHTANLGWLRQVYGDSDAIRRRGRRAWRRRARSAMR
jgi:hypothetical protein